VAHSFQNVSSEDLFIIHCRDDLVPEPMGPKDWEDVAQEFNQRFRDGSKKSLVGATMSRRSGDARKTFVRDNPEYEEARRYPIPVILQDDKELTMDLIDPALETAVPRLQTLSPSFIFDNPDICPNPHQHPPFHFSNTFITPHSTPAKPTVTTPRLIPGSYTPSAIHESSITPLTRLKFHLRHRIPELVIFHFLDLHQDKVAKDTAQYVDAPTLISISPFYTTKACKTLKTPPSQFLHILQSPQ